MPSDLHENLIDVADHLLRTDYECPEPGIRRTSKRDGGEEPDLWNFSIVLRGSVIVESLTSREAFTRDLKKSFRKPGHGIGQYRYIVCAYGLISPDELLERWGLWYVDDDGRVTVMRESKKFPCNHEMLLGERMLLVRDRMRFHEDGEGKTRGVDLRLQLAQPRSNVKSNVREWLDRVAEHIAGLTPITVSKAARYTSPPCTGSHATRKLRDLVSKGHLSGYKLHYERGVAHIDVAETESEEAA